MALESESLISSVQGSSWPEPCLWAGKKHNKEEQNKTKQLNRIKATQCSLTEHTHVPRRATTILSFLLLWCWWWSNCGHLLSRLWSMMEQAIKTKYTVVQWVAMLWQCFGQICGGKVKCVGGYWKRVEIYWFRDWLARQKIWKEAAEKWKGQKRWRLLKGLTGTKRGEDVNG